MVNDLLDLANLEAGKKEYQPVETRLSSLVEIVVRELTFSALEKKIRILFVKPGLNDRVVVDKNKIIQVIRKLIANSIKYSPKGSQIVLEIKRETDRLIFSVKDKGIGVPKSERELIFEKFVQGSRSKTGAGGTGIGLTISREIVNDHSGDIWVEDNPEGGSIFSVAIPPGEGNGEITYRASSPI